jgi:D-alanyl-D-alanine carboxypeptidase
MCKHAGIYWSLGVVMTAALLVCHDRAASAASPQAGVPPAGDALEEAVHTAVQAQLLSKGVPSVSVAVMRDGKMVLQRAWGLADVDKKLQADAATTYQIASVSKMFTAAMVLKQVDRGRLSLNDSIAKHFAGLKPEFHAITIEQLLNHTSGLPNDVRDPDQRLQRRTPDELFALIAAAKLAGEPGRAFVYSNTGYVLLGLLIQKVYGASYDAVLRDEIARPLGLTLAACAEPRSGEATGYMRTSDGTIAPPPGLHYSQLIGAGGICSSAGDLVKWLHALNTRRVLSPSSYTAMTTLRGAAAAGDYGLGLYVRPRTWGDKAIVGGGVTQNGFVAELQWYPEKATATAVLYNAAPRVPGAADLVPRIVLGVPAERAK